MKILFNERLAQVYDRWFKTKKGMLADRLEKELISRIVRLKPGEKILDVGCGTGNYLQYFWERDLKTIGIDISLPMVRVAKNKLGDKSGLCVGKAEALPFKANCFDCVCLITTLEFAEDPLKTLQEAVRVSREEIILGILNKYSLIALCRRIKGIFRPSIYNEAKFYSIWEFKKLFTRILPGSNMRWGSVLVLPLGLQQWFGRIERVLSFRKNPFGAFLVIGISIKQ